MQRNARGFTLVEILIVVIILGILAAIVIPQFTNASNDARNNSVSSTLQTLRSQIELFKIQHADNAPTNAQMWTALLNASNTTGTTNATANTTYPFGPYLQAAPANPLNGRTGIGSATGATIGWYYTVSGGQYTIRAYDTTGTVAMTY